ncbi:hypothetical protein OYT1_ch1285 [Ferriphaselus amnicola]|uniref:Uncharacterized protein n=1 Tax=Ferriphaselus amnicola TaxID=1188319 RepID=A0A2Z6GBT9_9PROT|nr:hypothetical protein OYT1_ch1285 [Ferriphaselus amnicola]
MTILVAISNSVVRERLSSVDMVCVDLVVFQT